ncbi:MAG: tetratricopeptide repeat protein [Solirubrobacteraceae bacterium]|nr:hypothetical protein [Patulibacter sp.]
MPRPSLFISHDADADWLTAIAYGFVDDDVDPRRWDPISCRSAWLLDEPGGRPIGVRVEEVSTAGLDEPEFLGGHFDDFVDPIGPRFDAPTLGLTEVSAAEVLIAAYAMHKSEHTLNRAFFNAAIQASGTEALRLWNLCLESGDPMAHYGLGLTTFDLGDTHRAYSHLRFYATLATHSPWAHSWLGRAALAEGHDDEAIAALRRAVELGLDTDTQTDAEELLARVL